MKIKTSEATPLQLNFLVAKCEGRNPSHYKGVVRATACPEFPDSPPMFGPELNYSTDWAQGGPLLERERIGVWPSDSIEGMWAARPDYEVYPERLPPSYGPTPLTAAMRCYVASKMGDEVEVPNELENL